MKNYEHIFFDLDHTLWDYDTNTSEAVFELFEYYDFKSLPVSREDFLRQFHEANNYLWDLYNHGHIDRMYLRHNRFKMIMEKLGFDERFVPEGIGEKYLSVAPSKNGLVDGAMDILQYLASNYQMHIISNGFDDVQYRKMEASGILHFFNKIITSDNSGFRKPQKEIFHFAMSRAESTFDNSIFIGDNPTTDIAGAISAEMDVIYYNPHKDPHEFKVTYEIVSLREIRNLL